MLVGLVSWLLGAGRWGAYVGVPGQPIYVSELLLAVVAGAWIYEQRGRARGVAPETSRLTILTWAALLALSSWAGLRFATSPSIGVTALRDFAPYGYGVVAVVGATRALRRRPALLAVGSALALHAAWVLAARYLPMPAWLPTLGLTRVFEIRNDFDGTVCGLTAVWFLYLAVARQHGPRMRAVLLLAASLNAVLVMTLLSRAGLVAMLAVAVAVASCSLPKAARWARASGVSTVMLTAAVLAVVVAGGAVVLGTGTGERLKSTFDLSQNRVADGGVASAGGTSRARLQAYRLVVRYAFASPGRAAVGVGFGPDYLTESGAASILEGTSFTGVRAPHNFVLGTLARLGLVGVGLQLLLMVASIACAATVLGKRPGSEVEAVIVLSLLVALPVAGLFGVIMESPFGAIPWFWAAGRAMWLVRCEGEGRSLVSCPAAQRSDHGEPDS